MKDGTAIGTLTYLDKVIMNKNCSDSSLPFYSPIVLHTEKGSVLNVVGIPEEILRENLCKKVMIIGDFYWEVLTIKAHRLRLEEQGKWRLIWQNTER